MNDRELETLLHEAGRDYRTPSDARIDAMWQQIEARAFDPPVRQLSRPWMRPLAYAATLVLGIGLGYGGNRWLASGGPGGSGPSAVASADRDVDTEPSPFVGVAGNYLEQTTALLVAVSDADERLAFSAGTVRRARELLSTTRLLLDTGVQNPALQELLQDLELVLAQVVRPSAEQPGGEGTFVSEALAQRDLLPRLTLILADAHGDQ